MEWDYKIVVLLSLLSYSIGTYLIWFSRWNVLAHLSLAFSITANVLPICFLDVFEFNSIEMLALYRDILLVGAVFYLTGLIVGVKLPSLKFFEISRSFDCDEWFCYSAIYNKVFALMLIGVVGLFLSYAIMGFVPMFAQDPLAAKFFKGPYHDPYMRIAILYRSSYMMLVALMPIACILWYRSKNVLMALLCVLAITGIGLSLTRAPAIFGAMTAAGIYCASRGGKAFLLYLLLIMIIFPFGSAIFFIFGIFDKDQGLLDLIAQGVPDISDQLLFLDSFIQKEEFTFGKTFIGGMIPGNFKWNPAVYTLDVTNGTDILEISSGGFRLPVSIWGYSAFGWIGVVCVPFVSGLILGNCIGFCKNFASQGNEIRFSVALSWLLSFGNFWSGFYVMSIYSVPRMFILFFVVYNVNLIFNRMCYQKTL